ncbi:MAG: sodium:calcium antiporter [Culicoidibacterales bacterium]
MLFLNFFIISFFVVILSVGVSYYAEKFEASLTTKSAVVGMILLALATSLPELTTAIVTSRDHHPELLLSNVLGSNFFNLLILAAIQIIFWKRNVLSHIPKGYIWSYICLLIMHIVILLGLGIIHTTNIFTFIPSLILVVLYYITIRLSPGSESQSTENTNAKKSLLLFIVFALLLVTSAFFLIKTVETMSEVYQLSSLFAGTVLIGVITSLPELVASITLVKRNQYKLLIEAIIGSNILNFFILVVGDFIMFNKSIFSVKPPMLFLNYLFLLTIASSLIFISLLSKKKKFKYLPYIFSCLIGLLYVITFFI